jgi:hypothetical protein
MLGRSELSQIETSGLEVFSRVAEQIEKRVVGLEEWTALPADRYTTLREGGGKPESGAK